MTDIRDIPTDPVDENGCYLCKYAYGCTVVGECPIGGPYLEREDDEIYEK